MNTILKVAALPALLLSLAVCSSSNPTNTTVLLANFNAEAVNSPPAGTQPVGTVQSSDGGSGGSVRVVALPDPAAPSKAARINHPTLGAAGPVLRAQFDSAHGTGHYGMLAAVFIPSDTGAVTLVLESLNGNVSSALQFLHLDFMPENNVRLNDNNADRFGTFPRDKTFVVSIVVDTTVSPFKATITLL